MRVEDLTELGGPPEETEGDAGSKAGGPAGKAGPPLIPILIAP